MTAEILIMNKSTVALAADSAVSIGTQNHTKIFNSVNKLFALHDDASIGIMIYNASSINGIEWEQLIKEYKINRKNKTFDHLNDYVSDFITFIEKGGFFPEEIQNEMFKEEIISIMLDMDKKHQEIQSKTSGGVGIRSF